MEHPRSSMRAVVGVVAAAAVVAGVGAGLLVHGRSGRRPVPRGPPPTTDSPGMPGRVSLDGRHYVGYTPDGTVVIDTPTGRTRSPNPLASSVQNPYTGCRR